ncbi:HlyD family efflux transporter periplasmic adaptor subunit [Alteromonas sediminis]|uniref:HlyD family efflux transporter periplasmic adaptor subunit n=1 Tax=Alteromonas sediminis TaxID=2259342 RepID=A0A3N5XZE1_9ALTE|nr:HlyD family efflux transporter periplasmic adaptor subunit [Alteromonas sediminis]RPJ66120.1 HlyD family efflux transporter periplasmic adaptor subunit [Alteromonas sediminis]
MIRDTQAQDTVIASPKKRVKKWIVAVTALVAIGFAANAMLSAPSADISIDRVSVQIGTLERGELVRDIVSNGRIVAANAPQLYSPEEGFVDLKVKAGDQVEQGQVVAIVDSPELNNTLKQARSELARLEGEMARQELDARRQTLLLNKQVDLAGVDLEAAERENRRAQASIKDHLISQIDFEKAVDDLARAQLTHKHAFEEVALAKDTLAFELQSAKETVEQQRLTVEELQRQVKNLHILASVSGVVGSLNVQPRARVAKNDTLMTLVDLTAYEAELNVAESYANDIGIGMQVEITMGATTRRGTVSAISPEVINREVITRVRFDDNNISGLRQNQQLSARILLENKANVLKVRRGSFLQAGGHVAYKLNGDVAERVNIQLGATSMREVEVLSGLEAGDQIVISSYEEFNQAPSLLLR